MGNGQQQNNKINNKQEVAFLYFIHILYMSNYMSMKVNYYVKNRLNSTASWIMLLLFLYTSTYVMLTKP